METTMTISSVVAILSAMLGGGVGVYLVAGVVKKLFGLNSAAAVHLMVLATAAVAAGAQYVLTMKDLPPQVLGVTTPAIYGVSQAVYNWSKQIGGVLNKVQAYDALQSAQGTPAAPAEVAVADVTVPAPEAVDAEDPATADFNA
jgi:hypothetical protein